MVSTFRKFLLCGLVLLAAAAEGHAFSLIGLRPSWQTDELNYGGCCGPMNINEEYRWTMPSISYGMTPAFLSYFGSRGEQEIEKAFQILNDLPAASDANLANFPLKTLRVNDRARALGLLDLKSVVLSTLMAHIGLESPLAYVFTFRARWIDPGGAPTNYYVLRRNFDPITKQPSSHINGDLYTYLTIVDSPNAIITALVDPLASNFPVSGGNFGLGAYFTGLTRDDMGGLRHIYLKSNYNLQGTDANAILAAGFAGPVGGGGGGGEPWSLPGSTGGGTGLSPWAPVVINTNATNAAVGGANTNYVTVAVRPGVEKLTFRKLAFDSILGGFTTTSTFWTDSYVTNGTTRTQRLALLLATPDMVIHGADIEDDPAASPHAAPQAVASFVFLTDYGDLSTGIGPITGPANVDFGINAGPGTYSSGNLIVVNTAGQIFMNTWPFTLSEANNTLRGHIWGSFDGTTNAPVVYPAGTLVDELEARVLGSR